MGFGLHVGEWSAVIEIGAVLVEGSRMLVRGGDDRVWIRVDEAGFTRSFVVEHGLHPQGVRRQEFVAAQEFGARVGGFCVLLPFRHRLWATTLAVVAGVTRYYYDGNVVRVQTGMASGRKVGIVGVNRDYQQLSGIPALDYSLGRREEWVVSKGRARAVEVWTAEMSGWSLGWVCSESALSVFLGAAGDGLRSHGELRALAREMRACGSREEDPPADLARRLAGRLAR